MSKQKIINDPIYGFITITDDLIFSLVEHPYFQRLRRIRQLGMTHWVYPGANHTRFQHALGAMYLMKQAVDVLRSKNHSISAEEEQGVLIAILLHDIGHGPFSHSLEDSIVNETKHEVLSELMMDKLNKDYNGKLSLAIKIFRNEYSKKFLHQLVSGQLDMDRMDYLNRDSFFTGVSEGVISNDRIIKMLEVVNDELVIEAKGIYSIEKFIVARRLMYWQVYLHKTVVSAEWLLIKILKRAKELVEHEEELFCTPSFKVFLSGNFSKKDFLKDESLLDTFAQLDDSDITSAIKVWSGHHDFVLSNLCSRMMNRNLFKIRIQNHDFEEKEIEELRHKVGELFKKQTEDRRPKTEVPASSPVSRLPSPDFLNYFVIKGKVINNAYTSKSDKINVVFKDGKIKDIAEAADTLNIFAMSDPVVKYFVCFPKEVTKVPM